MNIKALVDARDEVIEAAREMNDCYIDEERPVEHWDRAHEKLAAAIVKLDQIEDPLGSH